MAELFPYTFSLIGKKILLSNDAGDFFLSSENFLERLINKNCTKKDNEFLLRKGFAYNEANDFYYNSHLLRLKQKKQVAGKISYVIAIPTLRCDLACDYCQVSRASINAKGFDWTDEIIFAFKKFISGSSDRKLKIEFQGGEPSLRMDIIEDVVEHCDKEGIDAEFIICTNLSTLSESLRKLLERKDFFVSTSIDGPAKLHTDNRTKDEFITASVLKNYQEIQSTYGSGKVNALPTITNDSFEAIRNIIDYYVSIGQRSIFLRPVNYQGFARKTFAAAKDEYYNWISSYQKALQYIFDLNFNDSAQIVEVGFEVAIKRIFLPSYNSHVDLRSPNPAVRDYLVINYDGDLYPSDEARMLSRIRHIDLKMGNIVSGINAKILKDFNWNQMNEIHEDCIHCAYKPFCGIDTIDDLSRYNRTDLPKHETYFCKSNMSTFDNIFSKIEQNDPVAFFNIQGHLSGDFSLKPIMANWLYD